MRINGIGYVLFFALWGDHEFKVIGNGSPPRWKPANSGGARCTELRSGNAVMVRPGHFRRSLLTGRLVHDSMVSRRCREHQWWESRSGWR